MTHYYNFYFKHFVVITGIPCFRINKIAFLLKPLNFSDSHYFKRALMSRIMVYHCSGKRESIIELSFSLYIYICIYIYYIYQ